MGLEGQPRLELPPPSGGFSVGYRRVEVTDTTRREARGARKGLPRRLVLQIWYPSQGRIAHPTPYMDEVTARAWGSTHRLPLGFERAIMTRSETGLPLTDSLARLPVLLFSHGRSWPVQTYQMLLADLASRGWIVVGISHPGEEVVTTFADGTAVEFDQEEWKSEAEEARVLGREIDGMVTDARFVVDELIHWNTTANQLWRGRLDLDRLGYFGHSLGGSAAAVALVRDSRIHAAAALEGVVHDSASRPMTIPRPLLTMLGGYNRNELSLRDYRSGPGGVVYDAVVQGAWHASFADLLLVYRQTASAEWVARHRRELDPVRVNQIVTDYLDAFFRRYLFGAPTLLLRPYSETERGSFSTSGYPEVELRIVVP